MQKVSVEDEAKRGKLCVCVFKPIRFENVFQGNDDTASIDGPVPGLLGLQV